MNDDTIQDLKQFIATTIKQETAEIKTEIKRLDSKIDGLDSKIDDKTDEILSAIGDTTGDRFDRVEEDVKNLDTRVTKLESNPA